MEVAWVQPEDLVAHESWCSAAPRGSTCRAICGALSGAAALPDRWTEPLRNRIASSLPGFDGIAIDELARRTSAVA